MTICYVCLLVKQYRKLITVRACSHLLLAVYRDTRSVVVVVSVSLRNGGICGLTDDFNCDFAVKDLERLMDSAALVGTSMGIRVIEKLRKWSNRMTRLREGRARTRCQGIPLWRFFY